MGTLLWAERLKLRRSRIIWISAFSAVMVLFIVFMQGQYLYYGRRYIDISEWYMTAVQSLGSIYVFPAVIALAGSWMMCREEQDDTLKSLLLVPVQIPDLIRAKLVVSAIFSVIIYVFMFAAALAVEAVLHFSALDYKMVFKFFKIYLLEGIGIFLAVSPVIAIVYRLNKSYWLSLIFAELYSFLALFLGMNGILRFVYPITAAFCVAGYYEATPLQLVVSLLSLCACGGLTALVMRSTGNCVTKCFLKGLRVIA